MMLGVRIHRANSESSPSATVARARGLYVPLWRQLTNFKQGDESFRQLRIWLTITKPGQFFKLAVKAESLSVDLVLDCLFCAQTGAVHLKIAGTLTCN